MEFTIAPTIGVPIYQQLTLQICAGVARGRLQPGQRLPSVRELSQTLVVNPNTVARAYTELEREGVLYTRPGMGVFVSQAPAPLSKMARRERLVDRIDQVLIEAVRVGATPEEVAELVVERGGEFEWRQADTQTM